MKHLIKVLIIFTLFSCSENDLQLNEDNPPNLRSLSNQELELIAATNEFSFELIKELDQLAADENFFISPISVGYALGMLFNGADGETKQGIKNTLDFGKLSDTEINKSYKNLTSLLLSMDNTVELGIANSVWYRNTLTVQPNFANTINESYDAKIEGLDFNNPNAKDIINNWIAEKTNDRIQDMLSSVPPEAVMYLVNAIYFKADWTYQFEESATDKAPFYLEDGTTQQVDMMFSEGATISHAYTDNFQLIDIPYGNEQFVMTILLPNSDTGIADIWQSISASQLRNLDEQSDTATVTLYLPKFELNYKKSLKAILSDMGMQKAFSDEAELLNLFEESLNLKISDVIHQSFLKVDEKGSEAAAATIVEVGTTSVGGGEPQKIKVDRPFGLMIRERHSGAIMFAGKMQDLSE